MENGKKTQYNPKSDILSTTFCDIKTDRCINPELNCRECAVFIRVFGR
jgi:hypothetical protein